VDHTVTLCVLINEQSESPARECARRALASAPARLQRARKRALVDAEAELEHFLPALVQQAPRVWILIFGRYSARAHSMHVRIRARAH
jgi:hypothetical protein